VYASAWYLLLNANVNHFHLPFVQSRKFLRQTCAFAAKRALAKANFDASEAGGSGMAAIRDAASRVEPASGRTAQCASRGSRFGLRPAAGAAATEMSRY
jgi:hypothetical protein